MTSKAFKLRFSRHVARRRNDRIAMIGDAVIPGELGAASFSLTPGNRNFRDEALDRRRGLASLTVLIRRRRG